MRADFSGYATWHGVRCADGLTITANAFKHNDKKKVPLVWQHMHNEPANVLGHAILEYRPDGVYAYGFFNDTPTAKNAKNLVQHKDVEALSIYANKLQKQSMNVIHGEIREVSLVMAGANPGAFIDTVAIQHSDGTVKTLDEEAIVYGGVELEHSDDFELDSNLEFVKVEDIEHAENDEGENMPTEETLQDVVDSMTEKQRNVLNYLVGEAINTEAAHSDEEGETSDATAEDTTDTSEGESGTSEEVDEEGPEDNSDSSEETDDESTENNDSVQHDQEGTNMPQTRNVFEQNETKPSDDNYTLTHDDMRGIVQDSVRKGSMREAVKDFAIKHGIEDIEVLFPDARSVNTTPEFLKRRTEWVAGVMDGTHHTPFSRIKSLMADLTFDQARAKGYVKGAMKREEFFKVSKRVTTPQTVYKKQKLDRDDIVDITDFDVVAWLKGEMRLMLEEEVARAVLIGDGRSMADEDKIFEDNIRPIATDHELYNTTVNVNLDDAGSSPDEIVDAMIANRRHYRGSGMPTFYCSETVLATLLTAKDTLGRRLYSSVAEVATAMRVSRVVPVEAFESEEDLVGIMVDLRDYNIGTDRGGQVNLFDDFDLDFNQFKYLIETRLSGALVKPKAAITFRKVAGSDVLIVPNEPTFDGTDITIIDTANVVYTRTDTEAVVTNAGSPYTLAAGESLTIQATADSGFYFANDAEDSWTFTNENEA